jgi:hypothetical protein
MICARVTRESHHYKMRVLPAFTDSGTEVRSFCSREHGVDPLKLPIREVHELAVVGLPKIATLGSRQGLDVNGEPGLRMISEVW